MSVVLSTAMERAQHALNGGDYRGATEACQRIVSQFPTFAAAYRLLGEAQLEQGQTADAERAFAQALTRDPRQAEAYLGMGLIAEERGVLESSMAYCQVAWELAPQQPQFREPVVRVASRRYGSGWQRGQNHVPRPPTRVFEMVERHLGHGSPSRP